MSPRAGTTDTSLLLAEGCNLACPVCDCRGKPPDEGTQQRELRRGGGVLELRGEASRLKDLRALVQNARDAGWGAVYARTNGVAYAAEGRAEELRAAGLSGVVFFLASDRAAVHDAIARVRGAFTAGLAGLRAIAATGLDLVLEIPVLDPAIQDLRGMIALLAGVAPSARRVRLYTPSALRPVDGRAPRELAPPRWDRARDGLLAAIGFAREKGLEITLTERDGIPLCAVATQTPDGGIDVPERLLADRGGRPIPRHATSSLAPACDACGASRACPGTTTLYLSTHGAAGLSPLPRAPQQRPRERWDETRKSAARAAFFTVLRPTVHCNQDCWFCSANETSHNVEEDPGRMMRRIARLGRTGVEQISFSGGEPTLSRHLVDYVSVAKRTGVRSIELVTNAVLLDKPEKVDALVAAGLTNVFVSLHAHDEALARLQTRKMGDHARTVRALHLFARHDALRLDVNHVVSAQNHRHLVRFVEWMHAEFGARIGISFAYVTPQYKALERLADHVPRFSDVMPYLKRAIARANELGVEVVVGSRQGVPPCQLEEMMPWSDVLVSLSGALTEDLPQKQKGPACAACRFDLVCTGVWKPYAAVFGTGELRAIPGEKITPERCLAEPRIARFRPGIDRLDELRFGDGRIPRSDEIPLPEAPRERIHLPVAQASPAPRALRVAIVGTGRRGLAFAAALEQAGGFVLAGITSPHAPDKDLPEIAADVPRARTLAELCERATIDAVIVATSTRQHADITRDALARGLPCLVEKPLGATLAEAEALAAEAGERITVAQQLRTAGGLEEILTVLGDQKGPDRPLEIEVVHRATATSPASLHAWSRTALYELLIHLGDVAHAVAGEDLRIRKATAKGGGRPERVTLRARGAGPSQPDVTIELLLAEAADALEVRARLADGRRLSWIRSEGRDLVEVSDAGGKRTRTPPRGGDLARLLVAFRESVARGDRPKVSAEDGVRAMRLAAEAITALEAAGAPFDRAAEPKRVASVPLRDRVG
ncbi:radical SAM protein [Polyangium mundeleinium]|uniref:Radical SAM protein n=1 Tax=Polyangium mundeleinium TaxID=2995306 RepID=A0ABT5EIF9_9BACT|nr:radical SAM protein [Polyangium mundeleinium]MDC0741172.1 radical SAM protein [Polyangium mundeleinium]